MHRTLVPPPSSRAEFLSPSEAAARIGQDHFFSPLRMNDINLRARSAETADRYLSEYLGCLSTFTPAERDTIIQSVILANKLSGYMPKQTLRVNVPWNFAKLTGSCELEKNFPHTLGDVIVLSENVINRSQDARVLAETLLHEKVHVYQRMFPERTKYLLESVWNYEKITGPILSEFDFAARNNPDTDGFAYKLIGEDDGSSCISYMRFHSGNPNSIDDCGIKEEGGGCSDDTFRSLTASQKDHPYERMAYEIASVLSREQTLINSPLYDWMLENL